MYSSCSIVREKCLRVIYRPVYYGYLTPCSGLLGRRGNVTGHMRLCVGPLQVEHKMMEYNVTPAMTYVAKPGKMGFN